MLLDIVSTGADWVSLCAVRAQDTGVAAIQTREGVGVTAVLLQTSAVENVVWHVGLVPDIAPEESSSNSLASTRGVVQASGDLGASTRSSKHIADDPGALREAVEDEVRAGALLLELSDQGLTVADSVTDLNAVVTTLGEHDLEKVAGLA